VQAVVEALRDAEERVVAPQHEPACVHADAAGVRQQRPQHLRDPAAVGRGVHAPHGTVVHQRLGPARDGEEVREVVAFQDAAEPLERQRRHRDGREGPRAHAA
jgi:hypothetical protein